MVRVARSTRILITDKALVLLSVATLLLFVFSACGGMRTTSKLTYFPVVHYGILGKGWIVRGTTTIALLGQRGSSTQAGTGRTDLQVIGSSVADCQALT